MRQLTRADLCYASGVKFKPQWAYPIPKGKRAESFILPFSFTVTANGQPQNDFPWKLDDDTDWLFRGAVFAQCGTAESGAGPYIGNPALVRMRDPYGNPITNGPAVSGVPGSQDFVLAMGAIGQSGFDSINAFGFPFSCEIFCERGGVIIFDFLIPVLSTTPNPVQMQGTIIGAKLFEEC
jgi:hypothetical protein